MSSYFRCWCSVCNVVLLCGHSELEKHASGKKHSDLMLLHQLKGDLMDTNSSPAILDMNLVCTLHEIMFTHLENHSKNKSDSKYVMLAYKKTHHSYRLLFIFGALDRNIRIVCFCLYVSDKFCWS